MLFLIPFRNKILELTLTSLKYIFVVAEKLPHFELEGPLSLLDSIADRRDRQDREDRQDRQDRQDKTKRNCLISKKVHRV